MADDPGHKAMLYFLEILMYSNAPMSISQLAGRFGSRNFTPDMRQSSGGNEAGLKKFLLKYPSLFSVNGNLVSLNDGTALGGGGSFRESSPASSSGLSCLPDVSTETEAVQFFRAKILKKGDKWIPVKSLAGHLSQAQPEIRECVGPQNEFLAFIVKHPLIFELRDDNVCLKDNIRVNAADSDSSSEPPSLPPPTTPKIKKRPKSQELSAEIYKVAPPGGRTVTLAPTPTSPASKAGPVTMTANEYKAVMFIKNIIQKKGDMKVNSLSGHFSQAPESLRNTIGWSKPELHKFISGHDNIFTINEDEIVSVIKNTRLNVIITGSRPHVQSKPSVSDRKGQVFHIAKLWGIIDLGMHEHVFIDRTIFGKNVDDLNKLLKIGEWVCFDAIPAPKGSRARWKATKVWKETESIEDLIDKVAAKLDLPIDGIIREPQTILGNMNDEIRKIYPDLDDSTFSNATPLNIGGVKYSFQDAAPSGAGVVPVWNFHHVELEGMKDCDEMFSDEDQEASPRVSMVAERQYMNRSVMLDSPRVPTIHEIMKSNIEVIGGKKVSTIGCQTIVTGDVLATQLYHEDL